MISSQHNAVEYTLATGTTGLIIFTAQTLKQAEHYVADWGTRYGHTHLAHLSQLPPHTTVTDLYRLYPRNTTSLLKE